MRYKLETDGVIGERRLKEHLQSSNFARMVISCICDQKGDITVTVNDTGYANRLVNRLVSELYLREVEFHTISDNHETLFKMSDIDSRMKRYYTLLSRTRCGSSISHHFTLKQQDEISHLRIIIDHQL